MAGWYEITQANDGQYRFVLKAGNGEIILNRSYIKRKHQQSMVLSQFKKIVVTMRDMIV